MANPFDDQATGLLVVTNVDGQHALWPDFAPVPEGWVPVFGPQDRVACARYVADHWTDLRPGRLVLRLTAGQPEPPTFRGAHIQDTEVRHP